MDQGRAEGRRGERHRLGSKSVYRLEPLPAALEQDADQVDHQVGIAHGCLDRRRVTQIGLHSVDLSDPPERLQMAGQLGPAHGDANPVAALSERPHHMAAEKARAAEDRDQRVERSCGHRALFAFGVRCRYRIDSSLYRGGASGERAESGSRPPALLVHNVDKVKAGPLSVPAPCPGGGIGRRTSFRY